MFTVKYRHFQLAAAQSTDGPFFDMCEEINGPFQMISQGVENGLSVVHCHRSENYPGYTYGPYVLEDGDKTPRPTLWVMNEQGATVATYNL